MRKLLILFIGVFLLASTSLISAACEENQIDVNSASLEELMLIKHLGGKGIIAGRVIDSRPFESVDDLVKVSGIGEITLNNIKSQGLACVKGSEKEESEKQDEFDLSEIVTEIVEEKKEEPLKTSPENKVVELKVIALGENSKDIKTNNDNDFQDKEDKQNSGIMLFIAFCGLLFLLFSVKIIKNKFKYKNEFG